MKPPQQKAEDHCTAVPNIRMLTVSSQMLSAEAESGLPEAEDQPQIMKSTRPGANRKPDMNLVQYKQLNPIR